MPFRRSPKLSYSPTREEGAKIARASTKTLLRGRGSGSDFPAHFHGPRKRAARGPSPDRDRTGDRLNAIQALSQTELQPHAGRGREDSTCLYENVASWERVRERLPRSFPRPAEAGR